MVDEQRPTAPTGEQPSQDQPPQNPSIDDLAVTARDDAAHAADARASAADEAQPAAPGDATKAGWANIQGVVTQAASQADQATRAAGKQLTVTAAAVREQAGGSGRFSTVGQQVASGLEQGGNYLEQEGAGGAAGAVGRRWWALLALLGLGVAAIALSRRRARPASAGAEADVASA